MRNATLFEIVTGRIDFWVIELNIIEAFVIYAIIQMYIHYLYVVYTSKIGRELFEEKERELIKHASQNNARQTNMAKPRW